MNDNIIKILITAKDEASSVLSGIKNQAAETAEASKRFAVGLAAAATATAGFIGYGAKVAGDLEASRAGFITLLGSASEADKILAQIKKDAASTPFELPGLIQANQLLTSVTKDGQRSENMLLNVGKALAAMGKGQPELDRIIVNLQQIGAVGKASLMDVRQFAFAGIPIFEMLQQATGKSGDALNDFISEGGVTFDLLEQMFNKAGGAGGRFADAFKNQAGTFNQLLSNMKDNVTVAMADIVKSSGIFDIMKNAMAGVSDWISANQGNIANGIKNMFAWIKDNGALVAGILLGALAPAFVSMAAAVWGTLAPLLPFMAIGGAIAVVLNNWAQSIGGWGEVAKRVEPYIRTLKLGVSALIDAFKDPDVTSDGFVGAMERIGVAARMVFDFVKTKLVPLWKAELTAAFNVAKAVFNGVVAAIKFLMPSLTALWNTIATNLIPTLVRLWNWISPVLIPVLKVVAVIIGVAIVGAIWLFVNALNILLQVVTFVVNSIITIWNGIIAAITWVYNLVATVLTTAFNIWWGVVSFVLGAIVSYFTFVFNVITGILQVFGAIFYYIFAVIRGVALEVWWFIYNNAVAPVMNLIRAIVQAVGDFIGGVFNWIRNVAVSVWQGIYNFVAPIIRGIGNVVGGVVDSIVGFFSGLWGRISGAIRNVADGISGGISGAFEGMKNIAKGAINWVVDKVNGVIRAVNNSAGKLPGVPNIPEIPRLYTGGQVRQGGFAIVGEHGPEAVMLPAGANVVSNRATQAAIANGSLGGRGDTNVTIQVIHNGRGQFTQDDAVDMAKQIKDALRAQGLTFDQLSALRG